MLYKSPTKRYLKTFCQTTYWGLVTKMTQNKTSSWRTCITGYINSFIIYSLDTLTLAFVHYTFSI